MKLFIEEPSSMATYLLIPPDTGDPPEWVQENGKYHIVYQGDPAKGEPQLLLSGVKQQWSYRDKDAELVLKWPWEPSFYAGRLSVDLRLPGEPLLAETIILHAAAHKLTDKQFNQMVSDILKEAETCFALSPFHQQVSLSKERKDRSLADLEFARRYLKEIGFLLELMELSPNKRLIRSANLVPAAVAEPDESAADWVASEGVGYLRPAGFGRRLPGRASEYALTDLQLRKNQISFDTYENRFVVQFLLTLQRRLLKVRQDLTAASKKWDEQIDRPLVQARLAEVSTYIHRLSHWLERPLFRGMTDPTGRRHVSHVLQKHPVYSRLYQLSCRFRRTGETLEGDLLDMPLDMTWQLFEYWAYMMVVRCLREVGWVENTEGLFEVEYKTGKVAMALVRGSKCNVSLKHGHRLWFQRSYNEIKEGAGTETGEMKPDIVLERVKDGMIEEIIILDPKYRAREKSLQQAVKDIHAYRDGIRQFPSRKSLVTLGIILAPASDSKIFFPGFGEKAGLQGIQLIPGEPESLTALRDRLAALLIDW